MANLPLEIKFAQSLAGNEKKHRDRAVKKLQKYFHSKSSKKEGFTQEDFLKIWKGLHYCMWMQDKAVIQEELSATLSGLVHNLVTTDAQLLFIRVFFITEAREWNSIDVWRIDKFMMFVRNMLNESFVVLKKNKWSPALISNLTRVFMDTMMNPNNSSIPDGLKIHFADIYLDEVEKVGGNQLKSSQLIELLEPFTRFLQTCPNMALIRRTVERVYKPIIKCALHLHKKKSKATTDDDEEEDVPYIKLKFDCEKLGDHIFKVSQEPVVLARNRPVMYSIVTELKDAVQGVGKKDADEDVPLGISDQDFSKAIGSLVSMEMKQVKQKKHKKNKKETGDSEGKENEHSDADSNRETSNSDREQPSTSGQLLKKKRKLNTPVATTGQDEPLAKIKKTATTPVDPPSDGIKTLKSLKNKFNSLSKLGRGKEKFSIFEDGAGTHVKEHRVIKHAVSRKRQSLLSTSPWTVTSSPATETSGDVKTESVTVHRTREASVTERDMASVKIEAKKVKQSQETPNSKSFNSEKPGKAQKRSHAASEAVSSSGKAGSANKMPIPKIVVEDTGESKAKKEEPLQEGEVEIWVPNKKYKGYKEATPKSNFAQFDQSKPPSAFVKKAMLKANKTKEPQTTPHLSPNTLLKTPGSVKTPGSSKKVSFDMKKNKSQGFAESLNSPHTPYNPTKQPDQGILKASAGTSSSSLATSPSVSPSNIPSGSKPNVKKQPRGTPILSGGFFKNKAKRMRAVDFFL